MISNKRYINGSPLVSIHGGHSGQFCCHADNTLEEIVKEYIKKGFTWVGITEHIPPPSDEFLYADEKKAGKNARMLQEEFEEYFEVCKNLQKKYREKIIIFAGFEIDMYPGQKYVEKLIQKCKPDYFVGSIHLLNGESFDFDKEDYQKAITKYGGIENLYIKYFETQKEMIENFRPPVIGHFDYIRVFDPEYEERYKNPRIWDKIEENLKYIKKYDLILDLNVCPLRNGGTEPYPAKTILKRARELDIKVIPGDDSHGVDEAGKNIEEGIEILQEMRFNTNFKF